jgi:hypothetical protein
MSKSYLVSLDFDRLQQLYVEDPVQFETVRQEIIEEHLDKMQGDEVHTRRMRGLQFRIDMERRKKRPPLGTCLKISSMMWEQFYQDFHPALMSLQDSKK